MSTYDPNQPQNLPPPAEGVQSIQGNFATYATVFDNNHEALNLSNQGKHTNVILQEQVSDPSVDGSFDTLYSKSVTTNSSTSQELFARIPQFLTDDKPNDAVQLTFNTVSTAGPTQYQSFLPGGYLLFFGQATQIAQANPPVIPIVINLSPAPSEILCVIANSTNIIGTGGVWGQPIAVKVVNSSQFQINPTFTVLVNKIITWFCIARQ